MTKIKGFKGFDKDLKCRNKQYKVGETFEEDKAELCSRGLHFCENPLDVFCYYSPNNSRFCEVEADDVSDKIDSDSKRVSKKLTIKAEIGLAGLIKAGVEYIHSKVNWTKENSATGDYSGASATGYKSGASATGDYSGASATGNCSGASATGYKSGASAGKGSVAMSVGMLSKAKGAKGSFIVLTECEEIKDEYFIKTVKARKVDGKHIKEDTWYILKDGKFTICED